MRILTRYILREVSSHALIGLAVFTFVVFMRDVGRLLELVVRRSAPLPSVLEIFFLTLPTAFTVTIPMAVLVGILIGLSRMAADSEVTAMRAGGMGVGIFLRTIALFAVAAWMVALFNNVYLAPRAAASLAELQNRLQTSQVSFEVRPRVFYEDFHNYVLYVQDTASADGAAIWKGIFLANISNAAAPTITVAEQGVVVQESPSSLRLHLRNGTQHEAGARSDQQYSITTFQETDLVIALPPQPEEPRQAARTAEMTGRELLAGARETDDPSRARWLMTEFHRRMALPTACLVLALVGIPLGLSAKRGGKSTGFVLTIVLVFLYYFASLSGISLARQGRVSPMMGVWTANVLFLLAGLVLLWRVDRMPLDLGSVRGVWMAIRRRLPRAAPADALERAVSRRRVFSTRFPQIIDDYVLRSFTTYLGLIVASFVVLAMVFTFFEIVGDLNRVPASVWGEYLFIALPSRVYLVMPLCVLIAVLVTLGLMQKHSELTAMKATGISIYRVVFPLLVIAAVLAAGLFVFDHFYLPETNRRQERLFALIKGRPPQTFLRPDRRWIFGSNSNIYYYQIYDPHQDHFGVVTAFQFDPKTFNVVRRVQATRAHWAADLQKWVFEQGWEREFQGVAIEEFRKFDVATFDPFNEPPEYFEKEVKQSSEMNFDELRRYIGDLQQSGFDVVRLRVQLHKKFAFPAITFVMAVLAVPFSLAAGRRGALAGVAVAIGIAILYWVVSALFEAMGNVSQLPPTLAAWAPDLIFGLAGGYLLLKTPT